MMDVRDIWWLFWSLWVCVRTKEVFVFDGGPGREMGSH